MTAAPRPPILTEERALHVAAFSALVDAQLFGDEGLIPGYAAQNLLARLSTCGIAQVNASHDGLRMVMFGIGASSTGSAYGLFRDWQEKAKLRLQAGVQR